MPYSESRNEFLEKMLADSQAKFDKLTTDYYRLREQHKSCLNDLAAATRGEPFWSLFGLGKKAKAKRAAEAKETADRIRGLNSMLNDVNAQHHAAEVQCVELREKAAAKKEKVANLTENYERLHEENKNLYKLCNADRRIFLESGRKILAIRNMAKLSVYPGGLEQLDADLLAVQDLLEGE